MPSYISQADLEARLSAKVVRQICDDNNDGKADPSAIARIIEDAEAKFESAIRNVVSVLPLSPVPTEAKRLVLDIAEAYAAKRHPRYVRLDWERLMKACDVDLDRIATGKRRLNASPPEPTGIHQPPQQLGPISASGEEEARRFDDMGDF
jgi:phage gp36-like protein